MAFQTPSNLGAPVSPIELSESVRPTGKMRPAPWLPVKRFDERAGEYIVMYGGIPVAGCQPCTWDTTGKNAGFTDLFPASLLDALKDLAVADVGNTVFTYSATDAAAGVKHIATGVTVVAAQAVTYQALADAIFGTAVTFSDPTPDAGGDVSLQYVIDANGDPMDHVAPIGVLSYSAYRFPGGDGKNPNNFIFENKAFQDQVAITCDWLLELPVVAPATVTGSATAGAVALTVAVNLTGTPINTAGTYEVRLNGTVIPSATITAADPTTVTFGANVAVGDFVEVTAVSASAATALLADYPRYLRTGLNDRIAVGSYVKAGPAEGTYAPFIRGTDSEIDIIGQIIGVDRTVGRGALDKVKTYYESGALNVRSGLSSSLYSMPGSATSGKPGNMHRIGGSADAGVVRINLLK